MSPIADVSNALPFLKWVGGKRWLAARHSWLLPRSYSRYFEPFLGGGAILFHLQPNRAFLSDANNDLIRVYKAVKNDWYQIVRLLKRHQAGHSEEYYYSLRETRCSDPVKEAARFIYLNRACFNGIYRVNRQGQFNVPKGSKEKIVMDDDDFEAVARVLKNCRLVAQDFERTMMLTGHNDFVFIDPPYTVKHNNNGFIKYNQKLFGWEDQLRLKRSIEQAASRGVRVLLTNANHKSVRDLYKGLGTMHELTRSSVVSANSEHRRSSSELAIAIGYSVRDKRNDRHLSAKNGRILAARLSE